MRYMIENYKHIILDKYATFSGRASRREFWYFVLANFLIGIILGLIEGIIGFNPDSDRSVLADGYSLLVLIPSLAVAARRLHDINKSGWWMLVPLYNLYLFFQKGHQGSNRFDTVAATPAVAATELSPIPPATTQTNEPA